MTASDPVLSALADIVGSKGEAIRVAQALGAVGLAVVPVEMVTLPVSDPVESPVDGGVYGILAEERWAFIRDRPESFAEMPAGQPDMVASREPVVFKRVTS